MWPWVLFLTALPLCTHAATETPFGDCASNLSTLEQALFETGNNLFELNRVFFPPSLLTTRFIHVNYTFIDEDELETCTNVTYLWAIGEVLFLQPPTLFKINSLFFYYPNNELTTVYLQLPIECIELINKTDGECSCMNDSHMLDILTQQLNIYAKFTNQANVERSNTFTRAVCAGELYDMYYSGKNSDIDYVIAAATIVGPLPLLFFGFIFILLSTFLKLKKYVDEKKTSSILHTTKRKNIAALALVGIYISIYILILDILAVHIVHTSKHEYEPELSERPLPFNLGVVYSTLACDLLGCIIFLLIPSGIILYIKWCPTDSKSSASLDASTTEESPAGKDSNMKKSAISILRESIRSEDGKKDLISFVFPFYLVAPVMCIISHFGYILLAWITQPSRSTTTLILYYFLFCYLYLIFRKSYKIGTQIWRLLPKQSHSEAHENHQNEPQGAANAKESQNVACDNESQSATRENEAYELELVRACELELVLNVSKGESATPTAEVESAISPVEAENDVATTKDESNAEVKTAVPESAAPAKAKSKTSKDVPKQSKDGINVWVFFFNIAFGLIYLGFAVIFTMLVYLLPLASEDLFSYLFNVIQFMIVVVSTQFAYKLLAGKKFSFKRVLKHVKSITDGYREDYGDPDPEELHKNSNIVEETSDFIARKLLVPHLINNEKTIAKVTVRKKSDG